MIEEKAWYLSTTIWGSLVAVASALAATAGITIDPDSQVAIADAVLQLIAAGGALVAIYGRLSATHMIS